MRMILALSVLIVAEVNPTPVTADPIEESECVDALEQRLVLKMPMPVYIEEGRVHRDITAGERRSELARLTMIVRSSCAHDPKVRAQQDIDMRRLYIARSPECRFVWGRYVAMMTPGSGFKPEEIKREEEIMADKCPATSLDQRWLIENPGTVNDPELVSQPQPH